MVLIQLLLSSVLAHAACQADYQSTDILYVGDSISTAWLPYSSSVASSLAPHTVARFAVGGSASLNWMNGFKGKLFTHDDNTLCATRSGTLDRKVLAPEVPDLPRLLAAKKPAAVVVALGTNDIDNYCASIKKAGTTSAGAMWLRGAHKLAVLASDRPCVWILPLTYTSGAIFKNCQAVSGGVRGAITALKNEVSPACKTIDSSRECPAAKLGFDGIGIHPTQGSDTLGKCIGSAVRRALGDAGGRDASGLAGESSGGSSRPFRHSEAR